MKLLPAGIGFALLLALAACGSAASGGTASNRSAAPPVGSTASAGNSGNNGTPALSQVACSVLPVATASAVLHHPVAYANANMTAFGYPYESVCYYTVGNDPTGDSFYNLQAEVYCGPKVSATWQAESGSVTEAFPASSISGARIMPYGTDPDGAAASVRAPGNMILSVEDVGTGTSGTLGADQIDTGIEPLLAMLLSKVYASAVSQRACKQVMADAGNQSQ